MFYLSVLHQIAESVCYTDTCSVLAVGPKASAKVTCVLLVGSYQSVLVYRAFVKYQKHKDTFNISAFSRYLSFLHTLGLFLHSK